MKRVANGVVKPFIEGAQKILFTNPTERKRAQRQRDFEREHDPEAWIQRDLLKKAKQVADAERRAERSKKSINAKQKKAESMRRLRLAEIPQAIPEVATIILPLPDLLMVNQR